MSAALHSAGGPVRSGSPPQPPSAVVASLGTKRARPPVSDPFVSSFPAASPGHAGLVREFPEYARKRGHPFGRHQNSSGNVCAEKRNSLALRLRYQISLGVSAEGACSLAVRVPRQRMVHGRVLPVVSGVAARVRSLGCLRWYTKKLVRGKKHRGSEDTDCVRR